MLFTTDQFLQGLRADELCFIFFFPCFFLLTCIYIPVYFSIFSFILCLPGLPARIAAVWFGADEVSTATSIGVLGNQLGCAIGFLLPPIIVPDVDDFDVITYRLTIMLFSTAGYTTLLFILVIFFYKKQPPIPPSHAQILLNVGCFSGGGGDNNNKEVQFIDSLRRLVTNGGFVLLMLTYGVNAGSYYAIGTLLNPMILHYFPGEAINAGRIGLTLVVAGVIGSFIAGLLNTKLFYFYGIFKHKKSNAFILSNYNNLSKQYNCFDNVPCQFKILIEVLFIKQFVIIMQYKHI